jgi:integrase
VLSVTTGLRTKELRALRWNEVDLNAGTVAVYRAVRTTTDTKTPKSLTIPNETGITGGIRASFHGRS